MVKKTTKAFLAMPHNCSDAYKYCIHVLLRLSSSQKLSGHRPPDCSFSLLTWFWGLQMIPGLGNTDGHVPPKVFRCAGFAVHSPRPLLAERKHPDFPRHFNHSYTLNSKENSCSQNNKHIILHGFVCQEISQLLGSEPKSSRSLLCSEHYFFSKSQHLRCSDLHWLSYLHFFSNFHSVKNTLFYNSHVYHCFMFLQSAYSGN